MPVLLDLFFGEGCWLGAKLMGLASCLKFKVAAPGVSDTPAVWGLGG